MATSVMSSLSLKPSSFSVVDKAAGLPSLARSSTSFTVRASGGKKIKTDKPYGISLQSYNPKINESFLDFNLGYILMLIYYTYFICFLK